ncbi:Crp/Fnr family transcriptional regulator [Enterovirga sp. CN4-39]|uniref:Crp/Fnr family transcriptional regulator n=1 Tax=Enterovirga sp. CN4-39 TaxID=3400910 RepID=UPI003C0C1F20
MPVANNLDDLAGRIAENNLLSALRPDDLAIVAPSLHHWQGEAGMMLYQPGDEVRFVYFPCGPSLVSFVVDLDGGQAVETALIGREGAVGGIVSHGRLPAFARSEIQFPGHFLRLSTADLVEFEARSPSLRHLFARYADCLLAQVFQSVACNAVHTIEQRTVKWLLAAIDRTGDHDVPLTQEQLASMLGVGRSYISRVIQSLKRRHVLETRRGRVRVHDIDTLRRCSCGCNVTLRRHFDQVLAGVYPSIEESSKQKAQAGSSRPATLMEA